MRSLVLVVALSVVANTWAAARPKPQVGKASIYSKRFAHRKMANGRRMDPTASNAASKTLPLGTKALVTNLETGRSAVVTIEDRGPHVPGRIVDLSPATADEIGLERKDGLARVEVKPLELPAKR
jgi:rare lipoprotein A